MPCRRLKTKQDATIKGCDDRLSPDNYRECS